jgi:hypothetical protein
MPGCRDHVTISRAFSERLNIMLLLECCHGQCLLLLCGGSHVHWLAFVLCDIFVPMGTRERERITSLLHYTENSPRGDEHYY